LRIQSAAKEQFILRRKSGFMLALVHEVPLIGTSLIALVGTAIQAGSVAVEMFIVGRILAGIAVGMLYSSIPTYQSEIAPPATRGWIVGLHSLGLSVGYTVSSYIVCILIRRSPSSC
jgi:MFS family permease